MMWRCTVPGLRPYSSICVFPSPFPDRQSRPIRFYGDGFSPTGTHRRRSTIGSSFEQIAFDKRRSRRVSCPPSPQQKVLPSTNDSPYFGTGALRRIRSNSPSRGVRERNRGADPIAGDLEAFRGSSVSRRHRPEGRDLSESGPSLAVEPLSCRLPLFQQGTSAVSAGEPAAAL